MKDARYIWYCRVTRSLRHRDSMCTSTWAPFSRLFCPLFSAYIHICQFKERSLGEFLTPFSMVNLFLDKWIKMVNFKLGNEKWKVNWSTWLEHGTKKKEEIWVPDRNRTHKLPIPWRHVFGRLLGRGLRSYIFFFVPRQCPVDQFTFHKLFLLAFFHWLFVCLVIHRPPCSFVFLY